MVSNETPFFLNLPKKELKNDYYNFTRKMLYKKYTSNNFSIKTILTDSLIFNNKCRLVLFFKEFLISDNSCEYLRNYYQREDLKHILKKILEIYCLYSKIYPNYIILKENKFLYKNIRKKQKMIDENNKNNEIKKNSNNISNKDNELFTLSVRNEIKEFQENSTNKNNMDSISNRKNNSINKKRINDNWVYISNKNLNINLYNSKKSNNNQFNKNMSFDSFWTNDTNNLSTLLNAINEKITNDDKDDRDKSKNEDKSKKKDINYRNGKHKYLKNKNIKKKEIKSSSKKIFKKVIYKKIDNKKLLSDNSRNNNFLKLKNKQIYLNNLNITKPLSSSLSNNSNIILGLMNKGNNISNHLLTEKNIEKEIKNNIHQYYSIQRDTSDKNIGNKLNKLVPPLIEKKFYSKNYPKENKKKQNQSTKKNEKENDVAKNVKMSNDKFNKYIRKKSPPKEFLKIILDESKKNCFNEQSIKDENVKNGSFNTKLLYNTNNNFNILRNKKYFLKKYFTNNNLNQKTMNQRYTYNLTESNSQTFINYKKEKKFNSSCNNYKNKKKNNINDNNDINIKHVNNCQTSTNYYILKNQNSTINNISKKYSIKKQKTEGTIFGIRDKMLKGCMGMAYIKKKCFSPISNNYIRRFSLSRSYNIQKEKKNKQINKEKLIERQKINSKIKNKLTDIRKNIRKQIIINDNNTDKIYLTNKSSINKKNNNSNLIMDTSQKVYVNNLNTLNIKENFRNTKKVYLRKNFSPTLTYYNLYKSNNKDLSQSKNNFNNNSEFIEYHHENLFIKRKNKIIKINNNDSSMNKLDNKENNIYINNQKFNIKENNKMTKSRTEYENFLPKIKNINNIKNDEQNEINKKCILKRFQKKPKNFYIFSKDKINNNNFNEIAFQRFNNLSNSTINNNSNLNEFTITKNINNSLSNSTNNITEFQTPLIQKKRLKLIKKIISQEQKENAGHISHIENISNKIAIKVNRTKFFERVKEKMKNRITLNQIEN